MDLLHTGKDIKRLNELAGILIRHGFGDILQRLHIKDSLLQIGKLMRIQPPESLLHLPPSKRAAQALEQMGPTFIKLGQILATRIDLLPQDWIDELGQLQDNTTTTPFTELKTVLQDAFEGEIEAQFQFIDPIPIASASIAQVHKAITNDGKTIVLKIRKPNIKNVIESDLRLLKHIATLLNEQSIEMQRFRPLQLVREFERSLLRELDLATEAKNAEKIANNLTELKFIHIPKIYWQWTTEQVNAQEYIQGTKARDIHKLSNSRINAKIVVQRGARAIWKMMLIDGFFHADPHPGNIIILPKNEIALLDFGMIGRLSQHRKQQLFRILRYVVLRDAKQVANVILEWTDPKQFRVEELILDIDLFIENYYGMSLQDLHIPEILQDATQLLHRYDIHLPPDIVMFTKTCITLEGFGRLLYPQFNLTSEAKPLIDQAIKNKLKPNYLFKTFGTAIAQSAEKLHRQMTDPPIPETPPTLQQGSLSKSEFRRLTGRVEKSIYRLSQATLLASLFIGSAIISLLPTGPKIFGMHFLGFMGFFAVAISSSWLLLLMWWSTRSR